MGRKSKAIAVPENKKVDEKESDELREKYFKKLMQETKTKRYKVCMKYVAEKFNPNDSLAKSSRSLFMILFVEICELERECDEALSKLREYEKRQT